MSTPPLRRILIIEDEEDIQAVMKLTLEAVGGFSVSVCSSGAEALAAAPIFAPDLILLDVLLPDMNGPSILSALRTLPETATTPVVFVTAKTQFQDLAHLKSQGAVSVIPKPFDPFTFPEMITAIWSDHHD